MTSIHTFLHGIESMTLGEIEEERHPHREGLYYTRELLIETGGVTQRLTLFADDRAALTVDVERDVQDAAITEFYQDRQRAQA